MERLAAIEEKMVTERLKRKMEDVNRAVKTHLAPVEDHVNFTLQRLYFKCAYECFDRRKLQEDIANCVEQCSLPALNANNFVETEMAKFQERLNRSMMVCQDKFESAKLRQMNTSAVGELESCVDQAIQDSIQVLPLIVSRIKKVLSIDEQH